MHILKKVQISKTCISILILIFTINKLYSTVLFENDTYNQTIENARYEQTASQATTEAMNFFQSSALFMIGENDNNSLRKLEKELFNFCENFSDYSPRKNEIYESFKVCRSIININYIKKFKQEDIERILFKITVLQSFFKFDIEIYKYVFFAKLLDLKYDMDELSLLNLYPDQNKFELCKQCNKKWVQANKNLGLNATTCLLCGNEIFENEHEKQEPESFVNNIILFNVYENDNTSTAKSNNSCSNSFESIFSSSGDISQICEQTIGSQKEVTVTVENDEINEAKKILKLYYEGLQTLEEKNVVKNVINIISYHNKNKFLSLLSPFMQYINSGLNRAIFIVIANEVPVNAFDNMITALYSFIDVNTKANDEIFKDFIITLSKDWSHT